MVSPFHGNGWTLEALPMTDDLAVRPADLLSQVTGGVLPHTPYLGRQDSPTRSEIGALRSKAMVAKSNALARGNDNTAHRLHFERAKHATETQTKPAQISQETISPI
jgi:hypothetical protein